MMQAAEKISLSTDLVPLESYVPAEIFVENGLEPILVEIEKMVRSVDRDVSTERGRKDIASYARKIASTKTAIEEMGKALTADWKKRAKVVDAEKARAWDRLQALQDEFRKPLTDLEEAEKIRVASHETALEELGQLMTFVLGRDVVSVESVEARLARLQKLSAGRSWEEFAHRAKDASDRVYAALTDKLAEIKKAEADRLENERLRKEAADRAEADRIEKARLAGIEEGKKQAAAEAAQASQPVQAPSEPEKAQTPPAAAPAAQTKAPAAGSVRLDPVFEAKRKVNAAIVKALVETGTLDSAETAQKVVKAIIAGKIPNVAINYQGEI